jgi:hypothetical protein
MAKAHLQKEKGLVNEEDDSVDNSEDLKSPLNSTQDEYSKLKREFNRFESNSSDEFDDCKPAAIVPQSTQGEFAALQTEFSEFQLEQEKPDNYLGAALSQMDNDQGNPCWTMSSDKYCNAFIKNVEEHLTSKGLQLPSKCKTPFTSGYKPESDCTGE